MLQKTTEIQQNEALSAQNQAQDSFTIDQVKMLWKQFAFKMKEEGIDSIYYAFTKRDPKILNEIEIHQEIDNQVQIDTIQEKISDLLEFVRKNLNNWSVQIFFDVIADENNTKSLTGKDKFEAMAKKNVNLFSFQKIFNLDVDY